MFFSASKDSGEHKHVPWYEKLDALKCIGATSEEIKAIAARYDMQAVDVVSFPMDFKSSDLDWRDVLADTENNAGIHAAIS